ncbi:MAG: discoidin domain-containing protein [Pirellulales bacterium]
MKLSTKPMLGLLALCGSLQFGYRVEAVPTNLATAGTASASSSHTDAFLYGPENANDGLRSSRNAFNDEIIYHGLQSSADPNTQHQELWYEVDLDADHYLDRVQLFSRLSNSSFTSRYYAAAQHVIHNFRIDVFNTANTNVFSQTYLPSKSTDDEPWAASDMRGVVGSRVRISRDPRHKILGGLANSTLILAEMEIWGQDTPPLENLALGRPVTATPHLTLGIVPVPADRAVDGNLSGHFWHGSIYESDSSTGAPFNGPFGNGHFWQVELEELSNINYVTVYARTDGEPSDAQAAGTWAGGVLDFRNGPIRISVLGSDGTSVVSSVDTTLGGDDLGMQRYDLTEVFASNPIGKFVRIESLDTTKTLTFGEVEVFGTSVSESFGDVEVPEPNGLAAILLLSVGGMFCSRQARKGRGVALLIVAVSALQGIPASAQPTNRTPTGTAAASSFLGGNLPINAADGNRVTNVIWHSANAPVPDIYGVQHWYEVDLGTDVYLDRLQIFPRNQFQDTVKNFTLTVFDSDDNVVFSELFLPTLTTGDRAWGTNDIRNVHGSRVRIIRDPPHAQWDRAFTFAEFEVWGQNTPIAENLALGKPVTSSTPLTNAGLTGPELANDGYIGGHFWHESVFVTDGTTGPYTGPFGNGHFWQVELDEPSEINYVNVFARSDDFSQNGPIRISIIGADGSTVVTSADTTLGDMDFNFNRYDVTQVFAGNPTGKFVRIEALDTALRLALAEVEVFGPAPVVEGLAGDFNDDGTVNAADYAVWRDHLGSTDPEALSGNGDATPLVDAADYALWTANFGATSGAGGATSIQNVPEPASVWLIAVAGAIVAVWPRLRKA